MLDRQIPGYIVASARYCVSETLVLYGVIGVWHHECLLVSIQGQLGIVKLTKYSEAETRRGAVENVAVSSLSATGEWKLG